MVNIILLNIGLHVLRIFGNERIFMILRNREKCLWSKCPSGRSSWLLHKLGRFVNSKLAPLKKYELEAITSFKRLL